MHSFKSGFVVWVENGEVGRQLAIAKEDEGKAALSIYIAKKDVTLQKWVCHTDGKAFKKRLVYGVALTIIILYCF